jgi:4-deoxy-L-threo-5-hexosulose-uronate ketol-isomerase
MVSHCKTDSNKEGGVVAETVVSLKPLYSTAPEAMSSITPADLRAKFLLEDLFVPGKANLCSTDLDRLIVGGICSREDIKLPAFHDLGTRSFHERRESGVINVGGRGTVLVSEREIVLDRFDCLYIGAGEHEVVFRGAGFSAASSTEPPAFYFLSCPAHRAFPVTKASLADAHIEEIGNADQCSRRRLVQYIHEGGIQSCQLVMGFTEVPDGSAWNTMPPHVHSRRSEVYLYFDLADGIVMHFMGEPQCTRHLVVRNRQAVLSPPWSIHCGVGTGRYRFVWGMAGENQAFADMDPVSFHELY